MVARKRVDVLEVNDFIIQNIEDHPADLAKVTAARFRLSRQATTAHLNRLLKQGLIKATGRTRARRYSLPDTVWIDEIAISPDLEEDIVWRDEIAPRIKDLPGNVQTICNYGFTEMLNNVKDHSESKTAVLGVTRNAARTRLSVLDAGVGIFNKIQHTFGLNDPRHALLELTKGKLTTDRQRHTGEGVFFTSRMFDTFTISSGNLYYQCNSRNAEHEWLIDVGESLPTDGTTVLMEISNRATQTVKEIFDQYASDELDYGFSKTRVPIQLAMYEGEQMLSRSQAKRILARVERFREVILDYQGVTEIGQAFADEIYRVFATQHPEVHIDSAFTTPDIDRMIARAKSGEAETNGFQQLSLPSQGGSEA